MATLPNLRVGIGLDSAVFIAETRNVNQSIQSIGRTTQQQTTVISRGFDSASKAVATLGRGLATLGVGIGVGALVSATRNAIEFADALDDLSSQTGVSVRRLQELRQTAIQTGGSAEALDKSVQIFARNLGKAADGTGTLGKTLVNMGIDIFDAGGNIRSTESVLLDFIEATSDVESAAERARLANEAFGRGGAELVNLLSLTRAELQAYAADTSVVSDATVRSLADSQAAIDRFSNALQTTFVTAAGAAIQTGEGLIEVIKRITGAAEATRLQQLTEKQFELSAAMDTAARAAASGDKVAQAHLETLRMEAQLLVDETAALQAVEQAQKKLHAAVPETTATLEDQGRAVTGAATATNELVGAQKRLQEAGAFLTKTSAVEERFDSQAEAADKAAKRTEELLSGMQTFAKEQDRIAQTRSRETDAAQRDLERQAEQTSDLMLEPWRNAIADAQSTMTDFFEFALNGSITTFEDMADAFKQIFIRGVANAMATAIFNPSMIQSFFAPGAPGATAAAGGSWFGGWGGQPGVANPAAGGTRTGPGGMLVGGGATSSMGAPASTFAPGYSGLGPSLAGAAGGFAVGSGVGGAIGGNQQNAMIGSAIGTAAGAAIGTFLLPGLGTAAGAFIGGALGGIAGGFFGGGKSDKVTGTVGGGLGAAGGGVLGDAIKEFDRGISQLLNARQRKAVDAALRQAGGTSFSFKGELGPGTLEHVTGERARDIARTLGFRAQAIAPGATSPQQALENLQTAIATQKAIAELTSKTSTYSRQIAETSAQFVELRAQGRRFGISIEGLAEAQTKAVEDIRAARKADQEAREEQRRSLNAQFGTMLDPFKALSAPLDALKNQLEFVGLGPAAQFEKMQAEFQRISAEAVGGSIPAIQQFDAASRAFIDLAGQVGASPGQQAAITQVRETMEQIQTGIADSQAEASQGVESEIRRASRDQVDTLRELRDEIREGLRKLEKAVREN